jgi:hypothetical protein
VQIYTLFILIILGQFGFFNHIAFAWYLNSKFRTEEVYAVHARGHWRIEAVVFSRGFLFYFILFYFILFYLTTCSAEVEAARNRQN